MARTPSTMPPLGMAAPDFDLPVTNTSDRRTLADFDGSPGLLVMFICSHCPFVIHIREELAAFAREYGERGLGVVAIAANDLGTHPQDGPNGMAAEAAAAGYTFPYLFDESQEVAKAYGAACTPDFFLFDGDRRLVYRGQFDASRPGNDIVVTGSDLRAASDALLAGGTPSADQIPSVGCNIKWRPGNEPDYFGA
jgi:thiol-disulfide isomerase/thioredoxin